jgi:FkbM family methyltransferase
MSYDDRAADAASAAREPLVSVVMPVRNAEQFLCEAIDSVLTQSLSELELIVVDDGSTDTSGAIMADYAFADPRVVVVQQEGKGIGAALNRGFAVARAPYVARLDADDVALPDRLEHQRRFLIENESAALVAGGSQLIDEHGRTLLEALPPAGDAALRKALADVTPFAHSSVMLRKTAFDRVGGYRSMLASAEDLDLWLRLADYYELAALAEIVVLYRMHPRQATVRELELQALCCVAARAAARERAAGRTDPLESLESLDRETVTELGSSEAEITSTLVTITNWLAKTHTRAGQPKIGEDIFALGLDAARSASGSRALVARVRAERARVRHEQGRFLQSKLDSILAAVAEPRRIPDLARRKLLDVGLSVADRCGRRRQRNGAQVSTDDAIERWHVRQLLCLESLPRRAKWDVLALFATRSWRRRPVRIRIGRGSVYLDPQSLPADWETWLHIFFYPTYPIDFRDAVVVDVGAHKGYFSAAALEGGARKVFSYEPEKRNFALLERAASSSGVPDVWLRRCAAVGGTSRSAAALYVAKGAWSSWAHSLLADGPPGVGAATEPVDVVSMASVLREVAGVEGSRLVVKIDAEGAECEIVLQTEPRSWASVDELLLEYHDFAPCALKDFVAHLGRAGLIHRGSAHLVDRFSRADGEPAGRPGDGEPGDS